MSSTTTRDDTTSGFGRGAVQLAAANALYVLTAYVTTTGTARILEPSEFAGFGVAMAWVSVLTAILVKGLSTSIGREMAAGAVDPATAWHAGRRLGARSSLALTVLGLLLAWPVAQVLGADHVLPIAIGSLGAATFGANAVLLAWPIGTRDYARQAITQVTYALARAALVLGGAALIGGDGAIVGYVLAPLAACLPLLARRPAATTDIRPIARRMARAAIPVGLVSLAVTAYFVVDVFALSNAVGAGSRHVGTYVAYGTIAHVPFFLLQATSVAMVPAIAAAAAHERAASIRRTMTDTIVLLAGPTAILVTAGDAAARVVFGAEYDASGSIVAPLAIATAAVTLLAGLVAVEIALDRRHTTMSVTSLGVVAVFAAALAGTTASDDVPGAVATNVAVASVLVALVHGAMTRIRHGGLLELRRSALGVLVGVAVSLPPLLAPSDVSRLAIAAACSLAWLGAIIALRLVDVRRASATQVEVAP